MELGPSTIAPEVLEVFRCPQPLAPARTAVRVGLTTVLLALTVIIVGTLLVAYVQRVPETAGIANVAAPRGSLIYSAPLDGSIGPHLQATRRVDYGG